MLWGRISGGECSCWWTDQPACQRGAQAVRETKKIRSTVSVEWLFHLMSRDDRAAIKLFMAGIRGWEAGLRRGLENGKSNGD